MNPALWVSQTGLTAQNKQLSSISNNLANINTVGFKRDRVVFEDLFYQVQQQPGANNTQETEAPIGIQLGTGVKIAGTQKIFTQGNMQTSSSPYDMAIIGDGFFTIDMPDGTQAYTRNGEFQISANGELVTTAGQVVGGGIEIPPEALNVSIGKDGTVVARLPGNAQPEELGQIPLATFVNPAGLIPMGGNLYSPSGASGEAVESIAGQNGAGQIQQFTIETSNVNMVEEMVAMITAQRGYEMNAKVIAASDQMLKFANQTL